MQPSDDFSTERDAVVVLLFYATGIRLAELTGIRTEDFSDGYPDVEGEGQRR